MTSDEQLRMSPRMGRINRANCMRVPRGRSFERLCEDINAKEFVGSSRPMAMVFCTPPLSFFVLLFQESFSDFCSTTTKANGDTITHTITNRIR